MVKSVADDWIDDFGVGNSISLGVDEFGVHTLTFKIAVGDYL